MNIIKHKLIIKAIYESDSITPKLSHQHIVGRIGYVESLEYGKPMRFECEDGTLTTSVIDDFDETDYGVWVYTKNSVYRLDNVYEKERFNESYID